jgi:phosphate acetyltransferase
MLSFSTKWSALHEMSQKVIDATNMVKERFKTENITDVEIEWELQLDAALDEFVAKQKIKDWSWTGGANILIFPDLNTGNIGYKLIQYFGSAQAIWPIIQGLKKPWNDLSRWCCQSS